MNPSQRPPSTQRHFGQALLFLALSCTSVFAQSAPSPTEVQQATPTEADSKLTDENTKAPSTAKENEVVVLSPFEVRSDTKGYYSANTMSGTRFNTKLDDLASSISVMTKEQMADFAMIDINDVFLYTAGTEGSGTYTDVTLDRNGSISDNTQVNPTQANRVRGIAPANVSLSNIETMGRVPLDPLLVDSIEISRGPNANVFGLGNPSGTVNQVASSAHLFRNSNKLTYRVDGEGGHRATIDLNRVLLKGKLAIRASAVHQKDEFSRKPSGVFTERYNGMIKYQPFKNTTISGAIYSYRAWGTRPNSIPPRDNLSYWIASGRPTWDPVTQQIHINGATVATVTASTYNGPDYFTASYLGNDRSQLFIDNGAVGYWSAPRGTTSVTSPTAATLQAARFLQPTAAAGAVFSGSAPRPFAQPLFNTTPTISDSSIYDWSSINLSAPNSFLDHTITSTVQLDQIFIHDQMQTLAAQVTFLRENSDRFARNLIGVANDNGQSGQLTIDINERLLDGSPNPYFLRPYIGVDKPRSVWQPAQWDTTRAQVAYRLDLTREQGFLKNLGWFQFTGYGEYKYRLNRQYSYRDSITSATSWLASGIYRGFQSAPSGTPAINNLTSNYYRFYVGDKTGNNVDYAPTGFQYGSFPYVWGNAATGAMRTETLELGQVGADKTGGTFNSRTAIRTIGGVIQSHLFGDRLVTTLGARYDKVATKFGFAGNPTNAYLNSDGITFNTDLTDGWASTYFNNGGRTTNVQFVARPFANTRFTENLDRGGRVSSFMGELLNNVSFHFNHSNSFLVSTPAQDLYKNSLPNPSGEDTSFGLALSLFKNKVVIRATHYDNYQRDAQTNDMSTMAGRVLRMDFLTLGAGNPTPILNLRDNALHWVAFQNPGWTSDQVATEVARITKFDATQAAYYSNPSPPIGATADVHSRGTEIEVNYNPNKYWTVSASATKNETINENISAALVKWIDERLPVWTSLVDPSIRDADAIAEGNPNKLWWLHRYSAAPVSGANASYSATAQNAAENYQAFIGAPFAIIRAQEGKASPQIRKYNFRASTRYQLAGLSDNKFLKKMNVGGAVRWEDRAAIGYYGKQSLPAIITDLDPDRPIYDKSHYYVDAFIGYKTKMWHDAVSANFQLNVRNLGENGRLQPVGAFPDGTIHTYRIIDPQQIMFTASFEF